MIDTMTTQHQGHVPGGARTVACGHRGARSEFMSRPWREHTVAPAFLACTSIAGQGIEAFLSVTTNPAGITGLTSIDPTARHLVARST